MKTYMHFCMHIECTSLELKVFESKVKANMKNKMYVKYSIAISWLIGI